MIDLLRALKRRRSGTPRIRGWPRRRALITSSPTNLLMMTPPINNNQAALDLLAQVGSYTGWLCNFSYYLLLILLISESIIHYLLLILLISAGALYLRRIIWCWPACSVDIHKHVDRHIKHVQLTGISKFIIIIIIYTAVTTPFPVFYRGS